MKTLVPYMVVGLAGAVAGVYAWGWPFTASSPVRLSGVFAKLGPPCQKDMDLACWFYNRRAG